MAFSFVAFSFVFFLFKFFHYLFFHLKNSFPINSLTFPFSSYLASSTLFLSSFIFPFLLSLLPNLSILSFLSSIFPLFHPFLSSSLTYLCLPLSVIHIHAILNACNSKGIFNSIDYRLHTRREHRSKKNVDKQKHEKTRKRQENNNYMLTTLFQHDNQLININ